LTSPFFIILNLAVGGQLAGMISPDTVFPAQLQVDYVRVFQAVGE
jgi:beta-glucanase (GH16 family)